MGLGERERVLACLVEFHAGEVEGLTVLAGDLPLRGLGLRGCVILQAVSLQIAGGNLILRLRSGGQRERERLLRALNTGDLLRYLRGQLVAGVRLVAVLERNSRRVVLERGARGKLTVIDPLAITVQNRRLDFQCAVAVVGHCDLEGIDRLVVGVAGGNGLRHVLFHPVSVDVGAAFIAHVVVCELQALRQQAHGLGVPELHLGNLEGLRPTRDVKLLRRGVGGGQDELRAILTLGLIVLGRHRKAECAACITGAGEFLLNL